MDHSYPVRQKICTRGALSCGERGRSGLRDMTPALPEKGLRVMPFPHFKTY